MGIFNSTCPVPNSVIEQPNAEEPFLGDITFQRFLFYLGAAFTGITTALAVLLAVRHLTCYIRPREQRQIIRIAFYPVIFSLFSCFSIFNYGASLYLLPLASIYEPVALVGIFLLFVEFAHPEPETREQYFRNLEHQRKAGGGRFGGGKWQTEEGGSSRWYHAKYVALFIYFISSVVIHAAELILQAANRLCEYTFSLAFGNIYVIVISDIALGVGVLAVIQFYTRMKREPHFQAHSPTAKLISFKGIILLMFVQQTLFSILRTHNVFEAHPKVTVRDQHIGIQQCLVCLEMMLVVTSFHWSFRAGEYRQAKRNGAQNMSVLGAAANALNPMDILRGAAHAISLMRAGFGPMGNGSWKKNGGYQTVDLSRNTASFDGARGALQMKRFERNERGPSPTPPEYSDRRPLRDPSPYRAPQLETGDNAYMARVIAARHQQQNLAVPQTGYQAHPDARYDA